MARPRRDLERGFQRLEKLIAAVGGDTSLGRNEAATRFDLVDDLLLNVLGWPREQVRPEEHSRAGFADYVLGNPRRQLVVEAKKEGRYFHLPPETPPVAPLPTLFKLESDLKPVVEQAQDYASNFGLPYAVVTNGRQLVAFIATRLDGVEWIKGNALTFPSLEAMRDRFAELWDALSRAGVEGRRLSAILIRNGVVAPPAKVSTTIPGYPGQAPADPLITDLRMLGDLFLIDLVEHASVTDEFLKACYLESGALSQHAAVGRQILRARYSEPLKEELGVDIAPARTRKGLPAGLVSDVATASLSARPIILLGYVGVGKTIFIRHLVRIEAKDVLAGAIVLYVDLGREPALEQLEPFIAERFIHELVDTYDIRIFDSPFARSVYREQLEDFRRGPWGEIADSHGPEYKLREVAYLAELMSDRAVHLRHSLEFIGKARGRQIVSILDNVDQRPTPVQDRVFLIAETLAKSWPGTVFVSLRPDTFNRSRRTGTLTAYQPRVFAVSPPRIDRVLDKRLTFAQQQIARVDRLPANLAGLSNADALHRYLEIIRLSLRRSQALAELVDNLRPERATGA